MEFGVSWPPDSCNGVVRTTKRSWIRLAFGEQQLNYANAVTVEFFEQVKCIGGLQTAESPGAVPGRQV